MSILQSEMLEMEVCMKLPLLSVVFVHAQMASLLASLFCDWWSSVLVLTSRTNVFAARHQMQTEAEG
eukprot:379-Eustigmatos_ZCMA.PRE.1